MYSPFASATHTSDVESEFLHYGSFLGDHLHLELVLFRVFVLEKQVQLYHGAWSKLNIYG